MENTELTSDRSLKVKLRFALESWVRDPRLALRLLVKSPGFAAMAVLSLGLGIGASTIVFTVSRQVVLASLPVPQPERLVICKTRESNGGHSYTNGMNSSFSYPLYRDLNAAAPDPRPSLLTSRSQDTSSETKIRSAGILAAGM